MLSSQADDNNSNLSSSQKTVSCQHCNSSQRPEPGHVELCRMLAVGSTAMLWPDQGSLFFHSGCEAFRKYCQKEMREIRRPGEMKNIISCPPERPQTYETSLLKRFDNVLPFFSVETKAIQSSK